MVAESFGWWNNSIADEQLREDTEELFILTVLTYIGVFKGPGKGMKFEELSTSLTASGQKFHIV